MYIYLLSSGWHALNFTWNSHAVSYWYIPKFVFDYVNPNPISEEAQMHYKNPLRSLKLSKAQEATHNPHINSQNQEH